MSHRSENYTPDRELCKPKLEIGMVGTMVHQSDLFSQLVT
jgi:hypothetical protein